MKRTEEAHEAESIACEPVSHYESLDCYHVEACPHFVAAINRAQKAEAELAAIRTQLENTTKALDAECEQKYKLVAENLDLRGKIAAL